MNGELRLPWLLGRSRNLPPEVAVAKLTKMTTTTAEEHEFKPGVF